MQRLKSSLWYQVGKIVDEETINLGVNATPQFIGSLTELVWAQIGMPHFLSFRHTSCLRIRRGNECVSCHNVGRATKLCVTSGKIRLKIDIGNIAVDLESFAKHAGRSIIKTDDVLLLARRNDGLESILKDFVEKLKKHNEREREEKRKTKD